MTQTKTFTGTVFSDDVHYIVFHELLFWIAPSFVIDQTPTPWWQSQNGEIRWRVQEELATIVHPVLRDHVKQLSWIAKIVRLLT